MRIRFESWNGCSSKYGDSGRKQSGLRRSDEYVCVKLRKGRTEMMISSASALRVSATFTRSATNFRYVSNDGPSAGVDPSFGMDGLGVD